MTTTPETTRRINDAVYDEPFQYEGGSLYPAGTWLVTVTYDDGDWLLTVASRKVLEAFDLA